MFFSLFMCKLEIMYIYVYGNYNIVKIKMEEIYYFAMVIYFQNFDQCICFVEDDFFFFVYLYQVQ